MDTIDAQWLKPLRTALASFEKISREDEGDLMQWQETMMLVLTELPDFDFQAPEKDKLILRMTQCLHPEAYSFRVHFNVLYLLEIILQKKQGSANFFDDGIAILTSSLFAFYEVASVKLKRNVLQLLRVYYLPMGMHLPLCFTSLISALLVSMEEEEEHELISMAESLLVDISEIDSHAFYLGVWTAMLKCSRVKLMALRFLFDHKEAAEKAFDFLKDKQALLLVTTALKSTLLEEDPAVVGQALRLVKFLFPFYDRSLSRPVFQKLLMEVLMALKSKEFTIMKRVRDWMLLDDGGDLNELLDLLTPVMLELFERVPSYDEESLLPIEVMEALMDIDELCPLLFDSFCLLLLKHAATYEKSYDVKSRFTNLISSHSDRIELLWLQLFSQLEDHVMNFNLANTLTLIDFLLEVDCDPSECFEFKVLSLMLVAIGDYQNCYRGKVLRLGVKLLGNVKQNRKDEIVEKFEAFEEFMTKEMMDSLSAQDLDGCFRLYADMHKFAQYQSRTDWGVQLFKVIKSEHLEKLLITCDWLCTLCPPQSELKSQLESDSSDLAVFVLERLWELLPGEPTSTSVACMVIKYLGVFPYTRDVLLKKWLRETDNSLLCLNINRFVRVWRAGSFPGSYSLLSLFSAGAGVYQCLNALRHENPVVKMHAKEWLLEVLPRLEVVMHSVFALLDLQQPFKRQLRGVRHLASMLDACSSEVLTRLRDSHEKNALFTKLLGCLFDLLQGNLSDLEHAEGSLVQFNVCRVLKQIATCGWANVCFEMSQRLLEKMMQAFRQQDEVIRLELVELFLRIIFKSRLSEKSKRLKEVLETDECQQIVVLCTDLQIPVWLHKLPQMTKLFICLVDSKIASSTIKKILTSLIRFARTDEIFVPLDTTLQALLSLHMLGGLMDEYSQHLLYQYPDLSGMKLHPNAGDVFLTASQSSRRPMEHKTYVYLQLAFEQMSAAIAVFLPSLSNPHFKKLLNMMRPYARQFPKEVTAMFISLWISLKNQESLESSKEQNLCKALSSVYLALELPWPTMISCFDRFLREGLNMKKQSQPELQQMQELFTCEFLYRLAETSTSPRSSGEVWILLLHFCKALCYSSRSESHLWAMELLAQPDYRSNFLPLKGDDRTLIRSVQQRVLSLGRAGALMFGSEKRVDVPPPCCKNGDALQACALKTLKKCLVPLVRLGWSMQQEQVAQLKTLILQPLTNRLFEAELHQSDQLFAELLVAINDSVQSFAYCIRANLLDFMMSDAFWIRMRKANCSFESWRQLINSIAVHCYPDREVLVSEILKRLNVGLFTSKVSETQQHSRIIHCISLIIYCGNEDDYQRAQSLLTEKIIEWLKYEESRLSPLVFLLCRVLTLKMQMPSIAEEWPRLWPHLFIELHKFLSGRYPEGHKLAAVKFLELLKRMDIEDFRYYDWAFFYTSPNIEALEATLDGKFVPAVAKILPKRMTTLKTGHEGERKEQYRSLRIDFESATTQEIMTPAVNELMISVLEDESKYQNLDMKQVQSVVERDLLGN